MYQKLQKISKERRMRELEEARLNGFDHEEDMHKDDLFYGELDFGKFPFFLRWYVTSGLALRIVVKHWFFDLFMNLTIVTAGVLVGLGFYPDCPTR